MATPRSILHLDMDAFYVAVEVRRRPDLQGRPVVVGGGGPRGVVAAASYEARRFGIRSAMPGVRARRLCPHAVFLPGDHELYAAVSRDVHAILASVTPLIEPIALDEAFLDVTGAARRLGPAEGVAHALRDRIREELDLAASVGVAPSKLLAKLASEAAKPKAGRAGVRPGRGVVVVAPGEELDFLHPHPVEALWGVGPATLEKLHALKVRSVGDLAALPLSVLVGTLGESHGRHLHELSQAVDERPVQPDRAPKSIGHEETFAIDRIGADECAPEVVRLADGTAARLRAAGLSARTITLKVRFADFRTITRAHSLDRPVRTGPAIARAALALLDGVDLTGGVRLLGVSASGFTEPGAAGEPEQLSLDALLSGEAVPEPATGTSWDTSWEAASEAVDEVRRRFGAGAIGPAAAAGPAGVRVTRPGAAPWGPAAPSGD
jgi:DNA polymerase IV